jgi:hypothetical protein
MGAVYLETKYKIGKKYIERDIFEAASGATRSGIWVFLVDRVIVVARPPEAVRMSIGIR